MRHLPPLPPIVNSIFIRHKRQHKPNNNSKVYAIHDDLSTTTTIIIFPDLQSPQNLITTSGMISIMITARIDNNISYDIADGDLDSLQNSETNTTTPIHEATVSTI